MGRAKMTKEHAKEKSLPGLPLDQFEAAVDTLVALRDEGKLLVFLPRRNWLKFVLRPGEFEAAFKGRLGEKEQAEKVSRQALRETRDILGALLRFPSDNLVLRFLRDFVFDEVEGDDKRANQALDDLLRAKMAAVKKRLLTDAQRRRSTRIGTATGACLEELDFEVVKERRDELADSTLETPFLRLRFRYSQAREDLFPLFFPSHASFGLEAVDAFELECDETDIDLMIRRLMDAKGRLGAGPAEAEEG